MKPRVLLLLVALAAVAWIGAKTCSGNLLSDDEATPAAQSSDKPASVGSAGVEPAQLDLAALEAASVSLAREDAALSDPSEAIHGQVLTLTGSPAAGATVSLWTQPEKWSDPAELIGAESAAAISTVADEQGKFLFKNLRFTSYGLTAEKGKRRELKFPATPGQYVEIRLGESGTVRGQVKCATHGAEDFTGVVAIVANWSLYGFGAMPIRADGSFELNALPVGGCYVEVYVPGHTATSLEWVEIRQSGEIVGLAVELNPACAVSVKVIDAVTRLPISGALVQSGWREFVPDFRTGADGIAIVTCVTMAQSSTLFHLKDEPTHAIHASAEGYLDGHSKWTLPNDELKPQEHTGTIALYPGIPVTGRLLDARERPLARTHVSLSQGIYFLGEDSPADYHMSCRTDSAGRFVLHWGLGRPTIMGIYAGASGNWNRNLGPLSGPRDLGDLTLPALNTIPVLVVDDAGTPIPAADLHVTVKSGEDSLDLAAASPPDSAWFQASEQSVTTDAAGRCTILQPPQYPAEISLSIPDGAQHWRFPMSPRTKDTQEDLRLTLKGLGALTGRIRLADNTPVKCSLTLVHSYSSSEKWNFFTADDGSFRARGSFPARCDALVTMDSSGRVGTVRFTDLELARGPLDLRLPEFLPVQGRVVDQQGRSVPDATLIVEMLGESSYWNATSADGQFRFLLPAGNAARLVATRDLLDDVAGASVQVTAGQTDVTLLVPDQKNR